MAKARNEVWVVEMRGSEDAGDGDSDAWQPKRRFAEPNGMIGHTMKGSADESARSYRRNIDGEFRVARYIRDESSVAPKAKRKGVR